MPREPYALTHEENRKLRDLQAELAPIRNHLMKLQAAGFDVTEQLDRLDLLTRQREGLMANFPPRGIAVE